MPTLSMLRRPGLLLSAAATITVPGILAALALIGHDHAIPEMNAEAVSLGADAPAASLPEGQPTVPPVLAEYAAQPSAANGAAQVMKLSGMSTSTAAFGAASGVESVGMSLLGKAAAAGLQTSYQGVELIAQSSVVGSVTLISNVWHRGGGPTQMSDATVLADPGPSLAYDGDTRTSEGVFGVTKPLVALLGRNYVAVYRGVGSTVGRPALIVELRRPDGSLAARFWLDEKTLVPLRRDVFDTSAQLVSEEAFVQVQFGSFTAPPAAATPVGSNWQQAAAPGQLLRALNSQGWRLPGALPGGLSLYEAAQTHTGTGQVVDLGYSDGLSVISLFVQRGTLAPKMAGWQPVSLNGHTVYAAEHSLTWAAHGFVYTVIADAPPKVVEAVVSALPQNSAPGFLTRIGRGFRRMAALVDPFRLSALGPPPVPVRARTGLQW
jgi:sigma-E factor negative regulatory protein RseB